MIERAKQGAAFELYGGTDPAELPRYSYVEAARATNVPASTIAAWARGMSYTRPGKSSGYFSRVIDRPDPDDTRLSFNNLLEVNVLRALRQVHEVKVQAVRDAIESAKEELGISRLLIHANLRTTGGRLFLDYYFKLVDLSNTQQLAMEVFLRHSLQRVHVDNSRVDSFYPVPRSGPSNEARIIAVSPYIAFGSAIVDSRGITTTAIRSRYDLGEKKEAIIEDYGLSREEFDEAILYEAAA
jgi:uncharacterized protein (DUF433 family)